MALYSSSASDFETLGPVYSKGVLASSLPNPHRQTFLAV
jgi:hypothetical protein